MNQKLISIPLLFLCFSIGDIVLYAKNEFLPYAEILSSIGIIRNYKTEEEYGLFTSLSR